MGSVLVRPRDAFHAWKYRRENIEGAATTEQLRVLSAPAAGAERGQGQQCCGASASVTLGGRGPGSFLSVSQ